MSAPNDFVPTTSHTFHHENISPLVIQAAHSNSNFSPTNANGGFNGGFFPNSIGYDVAMLPFLHHTPQRPAHFNTFAHQKQSAVDNTPKEDLTQVPPPADARANVFNTETTNSPAYWSRQSQLSPFGVLPHEIPAEHIEPEATVLNTHFAPQPVNNIQMGPNNCPLDRDKKTQVIVSGKVKEGGKKYITKGANEVKIQNPSIITNNYNHEDIAYRNGVINHAGQSAMNKVTPSYNKNTSKPVPEVEPLQVNEQSARDYRVFKSPGLFPNSSVPVVKFTGKPKQYLHKQMVNNKTPQDISPVVKNHRLNTNGSPSMIQKITDFQDDTQSSPISLTSDDMGDPRNQYSGVEVAQHNLKDTEGESFHAMQMNNITHTSAVPVATGYREQLNDMSCQKNKVTPPFLKLPYTPAGGNNAQNNVVNDRNRNSFAPVYIMYNNPPPSLPTPKRVDKERVEQHAKMSMNITQEKPPQQNGLVGYSSVIMRTDRNYEGEEKPDKSSRRMVWNDRQVPGAGKCDKLIYNAKDNAQGGIQATVPDHHLLLGLTERQHSYFDNTPCTPQINTPMNNVKCVAKPMPKNIYEETQPHGAVAQNPESIHFQQYMPVNNVKTPIVNQADPQEPPEKYPRKRKSSKSTPHATTPAEYPRDPPPAHLNPYQQPLQNSTYMDGPRYEPASHNMPKMYPNNEQFYGQSINPYVTQEPTHQHQTVISSHPSTPRHSPSQARNIPPIPPALPLSTYFSTFHSGNTHYTPHHDFAADTAPYVGPETYQPEPRIEKESDNRSKVIVPNVEEEFRFLFDPATPNYKQIAWSAEEEESLKKAAASKPLLYRKNIDFLASYMKFLENNCESVESLTDGNASTVKTWNRSKVVYQPVIPPKEDDTPVPPTVAKDTPKPKEPEINFENDPRYYPLPKSSDKRRLDSSSDESGDEFVKKVKPAKKTEEKKKSVKKEHSKSEKKLKKEIKKFKVVKQSKDEDDERDGKTVKSKLEKLERAKQKVAKLQMKVEKKKHKADKIKPKMEKAIAEIQAIKQSGLVQKSKPNKEKVKESKPVPRRKVSDRKAKDEFMLKQQIQGAIDSEDDTRTDSDSDPSWTPRADDEENASKRKSTRIRSVRFKSKSSRKSDTGSFKRNFTGSSKKEASNTSPVGVKESHKNSKTSGSSHKVKTFFILKKELSTKHPNVWRLHDENRLQKFEYFEQDGRHLYRNSSEFCKFTENDKSKYQEVEVTVIEDKNDKTVVELSDDTEIPTDLKIKENFMKESLCYEHQFAVYIQTLVSQALDSNFLSEIVKENDVYFLSNMKVIDEVTATYLSDLTGVVKWGSNNVNILVKTWPFISIKNIRDSSKSTTKCSSCGESNAKQTAIFYGQPYQRETLQGCKPNSSIPSDMDKTVDLCRNCAREVKLFNKIWHQKYHVFIECAKYVSKKKSEDKNKGTTDILNELLADTNWLSKLFYDIRNTWLQIWTIVQKMKGS